MNWVANQNTLTDEEISIRFSMSMLKC